MLEHRHQCPVLIGLAAIAVVLAFSAAVMPVHGAPPRLGESGIGPAEPTDTCWEPTDDACRDVSVALPSRVTLNQAGMRDLRHQNRDPFVRPGADAPRLAVLARLAAEGRTLRFPRWRRTERRTAAGVPYPGRPNPFADLTVPLARPAQLFPVWTADTARWGAVQEALLASSSECPCLDVPSPGEVPDGDAVPGEPLRIARNTIVPTHLDLTWGASCIDVADDYSVHEGLVGSWYTHTRLTCTTDGALSYTLSPDTGRRYYLVAPLSAAAEGSYGTDSEGNQRPVSTTNCRASVVVEPCP